MDGYSRSHERLHDYADNKREQRRGSRDRAPEKNELAKNHGTERNDQSHGSAKSQSQPSSHTKSQSQPSSHTKPTVDNIQRTGTGASRHGRDRHSPMPQDRDRPRDSQSPYRGDQFKSPPMHRHFIHIEQASDTQVSATEDMVDMDRVMDISKQHLDPNSAAGKNTRNNRKKLESMLRNDSLSSDPSDCVRPPPPKPHKHKRGKKQRQHSLSSSDDEIRSTPECSSCEELDLESESVSEKGKIGSLIETILKVRRKEITFF